MMSLWPAIARYLRNNYQISGLVFHKNNFFQKKIDGTHQSSSWGLVWRNPKRFFILTKFRGSSGHLKFDKKSKTLAAASRWHCNNDDGVVITFKRIIFPTLSSTSWLLCLSFSHVDSFSSSLAHHDHYHLIPQTSSSCPVIFSLSFNSHSSTDLLAFLVSHSKPISLRQYPELPPQISSSNPRLSPH